MKKREGEAAGGNRAGDLAGSFLLRSLVERDQANLAREQQALVQQVLSPEAQSIVVTKEEGELEEEGYNVTEGEICRHEFPSEGRVELPHTQHDYGYSMSSNYNSRFRPPEVLIINSEAKQIRERETMDVLLRGQVELEF